MVPNIELFDHHDDEPEPVLDGRRQLAAAHEQAPVTCEGHHHASRIQGGRRQGRGQSVAHGTVTRRELRAEPAELEEALHPDGVVPGTVGDDGVVGNGVPDMGDHRRQIGVGRRNRWCGEALLFGAEFRQPRGAGGAAAKVAPRQRVGD
jgi:hypothetical protein